MLFYYINNIRALKYVFCFCFEYYENIVTLFSIIVINIGHE